MTTHVLTLNDIWGTPSKQKSESQVRKIPTHYDAKGSSLVVNPGKTDLKVNFVLGSFLLSGVAVAISLIVSIFFFATQRFTYSFVGMIFTLYSLNMYLTVERDVKKILKWPNKT